MNALYSLNAPIGRVLLVIIFLLSGIDKLGAIEGTQGYIESAGLPGVLIWPTIAVETIGAALVIIGFHARLAALALAGFSIAAAFFFHADFANQIQSIMFMKNIAIAGGLLMIVAAGPGKFAINQR